MFEFTDDCMTGFDMIDEEHKQLFSIINQLVETIGKYERGEYDEHKVEDYLQYFLEYGENHFAHEEAMMKKMNDSELKRQQYDHHFFMQKMQSIDLMELSDDEKKPIIKELLLYMIKWLYSHILNSDTLIGKVRHLSENPVIHHNEVTGSDEVVYCEFRPQYHTGIPEIDEEHAELFAIINDVYKVVEEDYSDDKYDEAMSLLDRLEEYADTHFSHEEEIMKEHNYPELALQQAAHASFITRLAEKDMGESENNRKAFLEDLLDFLYAWLGNHIMKMDKKIAQYIG